MEADVQFSHAQCVKAFDRVRAMTLLPDSRVREILARAMEETTQGRETLGADPLERAIMLANERLWAEEKAEGRARATAS